MIHPQAIIDPSAILAAGVSVGPFSVIGPNVSIGANTIIESHVVIKGPTTMGENNHIYQFSTVGEATPDLKYQGEETTLVIGNNNVIREGVTIHRGTVQDRAETFIGNDNLIMAYAHVGHDSVIGNNVILVNNVALAGHVIVGDYAILSGYVLVHQYCHIGAHCFIGMGSGVGMDVAAYTMVMGAPAQTRGLNLEGLRRRDFSKESIKAIKQAYKIVYRDGLKVEAALEALIPLAEAFPEVAVFSESIKQSTRGLVR